MIYVIMRFQRNKDCFHALHLAFWLLPRNLRITDHCIISFTVSANWIQLSCAWTKINILGQLFCICAIICQFLVSYSPPNQPTFLLVKQDPCCSADTQLVQGCFIHQNMFLFWMWYEAIESTRKWILKEQFLFSSPCFLQTKMIATWLSALSPLHYFWRIAKDLSCLLCKLIWGTTV